VVEAVALEGSYAESDYWRAAYNDQATALDRERAKNESLTRALRIAQGEVGAALSTGDDEVPQWVRDHLLRADGTLRAALSDNPDAGRADTTLGEQSHVGLNPDEPVLPSDTTPERCPSGAECVNLPTGGCRPGYCEEEEERVMREMPPVVWRCPGKKWPGGGRLHCGYLTDEEGSSECPKCGAEGDEEWDGWLPYIPATALDRERAKNESLTRIARELWAGLDRRTPPTPPPNTSDGSSRNLLERHAAALHPEEEKDG
jgi:hypothetical protein